MLQNLLLLFLYNLIFCSNIYSQTLQWRTLPNSPSVGSGTRLADVFFSNANTGWTIHYSPGQIFRTTNGGNTWDTTVIQSGTAFRSIGFFDSENGILGTLAGDSSKILFRSSNQGVNWVPITNLPAPWPKGICGISIVNENVAYACGKWDFFANAIKTTNRGATWSSVFSDTSLARSLVDCYFWTEDSGIVVGGYGVYSVILITTNGGNSWQRVYCCSRRDRCWKISFVTRKIGFVSIESQGLSYILKTTNGGYNWMEIPFRNYHQQGIGFLNENTGWVGGWGGPTYETTNGGAEWHLAGWGDNVNRFRFLNDTLAYASGRRIYKYSRETVGINLISDVIPVSYNLHQNYPNPFNPVTKIKFDIPLDVKRETSNVKLMIYNALGWEIQTLVNEDLSPGSYEVDFNSGNLSSGIYFYKLETGNFSEVKRMILIK